MTLQAFHNDKKIKDFYLKRVREHIELDEITKGVYFQDGKPGERKMCGVGCTIHSGDHAAYETELGIPEWLARLEDALFEGLPNERAKFWPDQFLSSIKVGADLEKIKIPFLIFILEDCLESMANAKYDAKKYPEVRAAIEQSTNVVKQMIEAHKSGNNTAWSAESAESAARSAESAESAVWFAARSAAESAAWFAAWSARSAVWSAAWSAESAAESAAWFAARSAEFAARSAAESAVWFAARSAAYEKYADKLLELMVGCE